MPQLDLPPFEERVIEENVDAAGVRGDRFTRRWRDWLNGVYAYEQGVTAWQTEPTANITFSTDAGSISVGLVRLCKFRQWGDWMEIAFNFQAIVLSGVGLELRFTIPEGKLIAPSATDQDFTGVCLINGTVNGPKVSFCSTGFGATARVIRIFRLQYNAGLGREEFVSWANDAGGLTGIRGSISFQTARSAA